jgi:predicted unusual protein kinase regulating ubiquinone biosynthesis (AarF/ABC1/UbiB family)
MFNLKGKGSDQYFKEVEDKLIEETNYTLELKQSQEVVAACRIDNLLLPEYYPEYSSEKIITMDWMEGFIFLSLKIQDPIVADKIGQACGIFICTKSIS